MELKKSRRADKAGVYFHIPFCKQACHYCDFHFVTSLKHKTDMLDAMAHEMTMQHAAGFLPESSKIGSIYFGGGTPSILEAAEINRLIEQVFSLYDSSEIQEITLEANPDDLTAQQIAALKQTGINRFSIGIQSFFDEDLQWMNRAHRAEEAESALKRVQDAGFSTITADLIYGYPLLSDEKWHYNIRRLIDLGVPHISAYGLTVEPRTALGHQVKKGREQAMDEEQSASQFEYLMDTLAQQGYGHYEISNWAKPGFEAVHNGNYWKGMPYLGVGPSAHSFNGQQLRQWNISNNARYVKSLQEGVLDFEAEELSPRDRVNEYIMPSLRTAWGLNPTWVEANIGAFYMEELLSSLSKLQDQGLASSHRTQQGSPPIFTLTRSGKLMADRIASDLFFE